MSPEDRKRLKAVADEVGLSLSSYSRRILLGYRIPSGDARPIPHINQETWTLLVEINDSIARLAEIEATDVSSSWKVKVAEGLGAFAEALAPLRRAVLGVDVETSR